MKVLNFIFALLGLLMVTIPTYANPGTAPKCNDPCNGEGSWKCSVAGRANTKSICRNGCWDFTTENACANNEVCIQNPGPNCMAKKDECKACESAFDRCVSNFNPCDSGCWWGCYSKICNTFDNGKCKNACGWSC